MHILILAKHVIMYPHNILFSELINCGWMAQLLSEYIASLKIIVQGCSSLVSFKNKENWHGENHMVHSSILQYLY